MGLTARQRRVFDTNQSIDKSMKDAKSESDKNVYSRAKTRLKDFKAGKLGRVGRLKQAAKKVVKKVKRTAKELIGGKNTYMPKKKKTVKPAPRAKPKGSRTKTVESGMAAAGLTKEEIARFGGR